MKITYNSLQNSYNNNFKNKKNLEPVFASQGYRKRNNLKVVIPEALFEVPEINRMFKDFVKSGVKIRHRVIDNCAHGNVICRSFVGLKDRQIKRITKYLAGFIF